MSWILPPTKKSENCQVSGMLLRREASWCPPISQIFVGSFSICWIFCNCEGLGGWFLKQKCLFFGIFTFFFHLKLGKVRFPFWKTCAYIFQSGVKSNYASTRFRFCFFAATQTLVFPTIQLGVVFGGAKNSCFKILWSCQKTTTHV